MYIHVCIYCVGLLLDSEQFDHRTTSLKYQALLKINILGMIIRNIICTLGKGRKQRSIYPRGDPNAKTVSYLKYDGINSASVFFFKVKIIIYKTLQLRGSI